MPSMSHAISALALSVLLAGCAGATAPSAPASPAKPGAKAAKPAPGPSLATLDGTAWKVAVEPDGDGKAFDDVLRFEEQHMGSAAQKALAGFDPATCSTQTPDSGPLSFQSTLTNKAGESFLVSGRAVPDRIWGTMTWRREDWTLKTYSFRGTRK